MPYTIEQPADPGQIRQLPESHQRLSGIACRDSAWAKLSAIFGAILLFCLITASAAIAADSPKILVLHSYHSGFQWTDDQNAAIITSLQSAYPKGDVFVEYMNTKRITLEVMSPMLRQHYATLHRNAGLNLIITTDNNALDFLLRYGEELFPGVPVVFCGINNFDDYDLSNRRNYTGVREDFDTAATLDIMLRFHPDTRTVAMIADVTESSQITLRIAREVAKKYEKVRFVELNGLSETVLAEELGKLKQGTVILLLSYYRSPEGRVFSVKDGVQLIQKQTQLPVYALWDFYMLPPVIGGKVTTGALQGKTAAGIAIRILKGEKPETIAPYSCPTSYYFNYDALQKFNIPDSLIPADSIITGKPDTLYARYKTYIQGGVAFAISLIATILILLRSIVLQRRNAALLRASEEKFRVLFENAIEGIFQVSPEGRFLSVNPSLCRILGYDSPDELMTSITDIKQQLYVNPEERDILFGADPGHDENLGFEVQVYRKSGEKIWISMSTRLERDAAGQPLKLEGIVSDITERKRMEEDILKLNAELSATLQTIPDPMFEVDRDGTYLNVWAQNPELLARQKELLLGRTVNDALEPDAAAVALAAICEADETGRSYGKIMRINFPEGTRWFELSLATKSGATGADTRFMVLSRDITERKQMEEDILKLNAELSATLLTIPDLLFELDRDGTYLNIWAQDQALLADRKESLLGRTVYDALDEEAAATVMAALHEADENNSSYGRIIRIVFGEAPRWFELSVSRKSGACPADTHFMVLSRDITERKQIDQRLRLLSFALDNVDEAAILVNEQGLLAYVNEGACRNLGYSRDELLALSVADLDPDWPADAWPGYWQELQKIGSQTFEGRHRAKDGRIFPVEISANYFEFCGKGFNLGLVRDISERKQMEDALRESEQQFRTLAENLPDNISRYDRTSRRVYINPQLEKTLGRSAASLVGLTPLEDNGEKFRAYQTVLEQVLVDGQDAELDLMVSDAEKGERYHNMRVVAERDADGTVIGAMVIGRDITEWKRMEQSLREERNLFISGPNVAFRWQAVDGWPVEYVSPNITQFGYTPEDFTCNRVSFISIIHPDDLTRVAEEIMSHSKENVACFEQEYRIARADGEYRWIYDFTVIIRDAAGAITHFHGYINDITERKLMEESLVTREQEFRTLADNSPDNINRYDTGCRLVYVNPQFEKTIGIPASAIIGKTTLEVNLSEESVKFTEKIKWVLETGEDADFDVILPDMGEGVRYHNIRFVAERGPNNEVTGVLAIGRDVTERMRLENALQKKGQMLEEAQRITHIGSWELDLTNNYLTWSDETYRIFEIAPDQFSASYETFLNLVHPDDHEMVKRAYDESLLNHTPYDIDHRLLFADGRIKFLHEHCETYYNADGVPLRSVGMVQDITEQRLSEETLRAKQHKLAELELELSLAEEQERQRIATVLHDHIGQLLLLARIKLGALQTQEKLAAAGQAVSDVRTLVDEAIQSTRSLTVQLCPPILSTLGLEAALELLCRQMLEEWELRVIFSDDQQPKPLQSELRTVLYQTARELLINVGKHAGTNRASLAISRDSAHCVLTIMDKGRGFDPEALTAASRQAKGFGLFNSMRRIRNLGGAFIIDSSPLQGTVITIRMPLVCEGEKL